MNDHFAFQRLVVQDIDVHHGAMPDKAGLTLDADDPFEIIGRMHAAKRMLQGIYAVPRTLHGTHAHVRCMTDAAPASTPHQIRAGRPLPRQERHAREEQQDGEKSQVAGGRRTGWLRDRAKRRDVE